MLDKKVVESFVEIGLAGGEPYDFSLVGETEIQKKHRIFLQREWLNRYGALVAFAHTQTGKAIGWIADFLRIQGINPDCENPYEKILEKMPETSCLGGKKGLLNRLLLLKKFFEEIGEKFPNLPFREIEETAQFMREGGWD